MDHVTQNLYVYVDDVDEHFDRVKQVGATILEEPQDQFYGDHRYAAADREGHHWYFAQHVRDAGNGRFNLLLPCRHVTEVGTIAQEIRLLRANTFKKITECRFGFLRS